MVGSIGIVGLGYVGLPLAVQAAEKGYDVLGVDLNPVLVDMVNARKTPYVNDSRFEEALVRVSSSALKATTRTDLLANVDNIIVCVPTPTENNVPDLNFVVAASRQISSILRGDHFVSIESTVNPGVTRGTVLPIIEAGSGLMAGDDFNLAHCPERIDPGNKKLFVGNINRVVGGITPGCTARAMSLYESVIDAKIIPLGSAEEAEFVKSWENSQRNINIAAANFAAMVCDAQGMDVKRVFKGLQSKIEQFGYGLVMPGIGPGGHCIPEDIHYVIKSARQNGVDAGFLEEAADLNDKMPAYAVHSLMNLMRRHSFKPADAKVAMLGLAYKPDVNDYRRSPAIEVAYELSRHMKEVRIHDPYIKDIDSLIRGVTMTNDMAEALDGIDAVFVATAHSEYCTKLTPHCLAEAGIRFVLDGRNCLNKNGIVDQGIFYKGIGI